MASLRRISLLLSLALPIGLAPGCDPNTSTKGQLIVCDVGAGGIANCKPTSESTTSDPNQCIDVDEDGDDDAHDEADEADGSGDDLRLTRPARFGDSGTVDDDDGDGTPDEVDDDDDNDGVDDATDCDERAGGDDYDGGAPTAR